MNKREDIAANVDRPLVIIYLLLLFIGWANIYSAAYSPEHPNLFDGAREYGRQSWWILACLVLGTALMMVRGEFLRNMALPIYLGVMFLLCLVPIIGKEVGGNKNWLGVGSFGVQPSEFGKFATALLLSKYLSGLKSLGELRSRVIASIIILIPAGLILLEKDVGTMLTFGAFILVLYREGLSGNILLLAIASAILAVLSLIMKDSVFHIPLIGKDISGQYFLILLIAIASLLAIWFVSRFVLKRYRRRTYGLILFTLIGSSAFISGFELLFQRMPERHQTRISVTLGLLDDPQGLGYNAAQSKTAIGSGGLLGKGYLEGTFTKYKYVPEQSTDFIFCTVGEEWGFVGTTIVVALFGALILRCIAVGERQRSRFTRIYAYCVASIFFLHLMINIGMAIGLAPVIGIPLPFFSYGGSSLIGFTILLGILVRLDAERLSQLH
ncbi:MAG: rod shape-determining protein RodA [Flavobacteriales bacterium]